MNKINNLSALSAKRYGLVLTVVVSLIFANCAPTKSVATQSPAGYTHQRILLRDEGISKLAYLDLTNPAANWYISIPAGRDMQLTGNGRVLVGTGTGYEEYEIATGKKVYELTTYPGTIGARRLKTGNTILTGVNWQGRQGIVLAEIDAKGVTQRLITYPGFDYARLVRETPSGTLLVTAGKTVFEGNYNGDITWRAAITGADKPNAWQALRMANGQTLVSCGYAKNFQVFSTDGKLMDTITGPAAMHPNFYAGFQVLTNGNYIVTNWQGHGPKFGASGTQLLEYAPDGKLAWSWKQDSTKFSSLQGVIVLDDLDVNFLHIEDADGKLAPVKITGEKN